MTTIPFSLKHREHLLLTLFSLLFIATLALNIGAISSFVYNDDNIDYFFPLMTEASRQIINGQLPLWNPFTLLGFPLLGDSQSMAFYPPTFLSYLFANLYGDLSTLLGFFFSFHLFASFFAMYGLLKKFSLNQITCLSLALTYSCNGFLLSVGRYWIVMIPAFTFIPALLWTYYCFKESSTLCKRLRYTVLSAFLYALLITGGYPEYILFAGMILGIHCLSDLIISKRKAPFFYGMATLFIALLLTSPLLYEVFNLMNHSGFSHSDKDYFVHVWGSVSLKGLLGIIIPTIKGEWNFFNVVQSSRYLYAGALLFPAAFVGVFSKNKKKWPLILIFAYATLSLLGDRYILSFLFTKSLFLLPIYNTTHWAMKHIIEIIFSMTLLAALGFKETKNNSILLRFSVATPSICAFFLLLFFIRTPQAFTSSSWGNLIFLIPSILFPFFFRNKSLLALLHLITLPYFFSQVSSYEFESKGVRTLIPPSPHGLHMATGGRTWTLSPSFTSPTTSSPVIDTSYNYGAVNQNLSFNNRSVFVFPRLTSLYGGPINAMFSKISISTSSWNALLESSFFQHLGVEYLHIDNSGLPHLKQLPPFFEKTIQDKSLTQYKNKRFQGFLHSLQSIRVTFAKHSPKSYEAIIECQSTSSCSISSSFLYLQQPVFVNQTRVNSFKTENLFLSFLIPPGTSSLEIQFYSPITLRLISFSALLWGILFMTFFGSFFKYFPFQSQRKVKLTTSL